MSTVFNQLPDQPMTPEDEAKLARRKDKEELVLRSLREAVLYMREMSKHKVEDGELVSLAYRALERSARNFKPNRGHRFFHFAKKALRGCLAEHWRSLDPVKHGKSVGWDTQLEDETKNRHPDLEDPETTSEMEGRVDFDYTIIDWEERWDEVLLAMNTLSRFERAIILFIKSTGLTFRETAEEFGCSRTWIGYRYNDAVQKIRAELDRKGRLL